MTQPTQPQPLALATRKAPGMVQAAQAYHPILQEAYRLWAAGHTAWLVSPQLTAHLVAQASDAQEALEARAKGHTNPFNILNAHLIDELAQEAPGLLQALFAAANL
jgi:hypothetical protein